MFPHNQLRLSNMLGYWDNLGPLLINNLVFPLNSWIVMLTEWSYCIISLNQDKICYVIYNVSCLGPILLRTLFNIL
jgi:hypothetical protein